MIRQRQQLFYRLRLSTVDQMYQEGQKEEFGNSDFHVLEDFVAHVDANEIRTPSNPMRERRGRPAAELPAETWPIANSEDMKITLVTPLLRDSCFFPFSMA